MTELNRAGQPGSLGQINTSQGEFRQQIDVVSDSLRQLAGNADVPGDPLSAPYILYVNSYTGDDTYVEGDYAATGDIERRISLQRLQCGYSEARPFRTINRAVLEAGVITSRTWMTDPARANALVTIVVLSGNHTVLNAPGLTDNAGNFPEWEDGKVPTDAELASFNPVARNGLILPRGCSLVSLDLRKTVLRPAFVPAPAPEAADLSNRAAIFRVTGEGYYYGFTFKDLDGATESHHLLSCFEFASEEELNEFYGKILRTFSGVDAANAVTQDREWQIVGPQPVVPSQAVDTTNSASPYIYNISIRSEFGLCGILADGAIPGGFRSMVVAQLTGVSLQRDMTCWQRYVDGEWVGVGNYGNYIAAPPDDVRMDPTQLSFHVRAINNAVIQEVSVFAIGQGVHHWTQSGGELTVTNSNSNFGGCAAISEGFKDEAFPPDATWSVNRLRVATNLADKTGNVKQIPIGTIAATVPNDATTIELTLPLQEGVYDQDIPRILERLYYTFRNNSFLWVENSRSADYRAQLTAVAWDPANPTEISVQTVFENEDGDRPGDPVLDPGGNPTGLFYPDLAGARVYIRRLQDNRTSNERRYAVLGATVNNAARIPLRNYIFETDQTSTDINGPIPPGNMIGVSRASDIRDTANSRALIELRRQNPNNNWVSGRYYRTGDTVRLNNKHWTCTLENDDQVFDTQKWSESFVHMAAEYNSEDYFKHAQPPIYFDNDTDGTVTSTTLGYNLETVWSTDALIQNQYRTATDYLGMHSMLVGLGFSEADAHTLLLPRDSDTRDRNPVNGLDGIPAPNGAANAWTNWPIEFRRPSSIRLFGHAYEWPGFANYSKSLPQYQQGLTTTNKFTYYFTNVAGGRVYGSGFNEEGFLVTPAGIQDLTTGEEAGLDTLAAAQPADEIEFPTFYESLSVNDLTCNTQLALNGSVTGNPNWQGGFGGVLPALPIADETDQGIVELATPAEAQARASNSLAVTPEALGAALQDTEDDIIALIANRLVPVGTIFHVAGATAPAGFLIANGDTVPNGTGTVQGVTADFSALFAVLGTTYGGAGLLPDLRGQFIRSWNDQPIGDDPDRVRGSLQGDATAAPANPFTGGTSQQGDHNHTVNVNARTANFQVQGNDLQVPQAGGSNYTTNGAGAHTHTVNITGGGDAETRPVNMALLAVIKF